MKRKLKKNIKKREKRILLLPYDLERNQETLEMELKLEGLEESFIDVGSARCEFIKFRCSNFEKKLLKVKAKKSGLTLSEYIRKVAFKDKIIERLTDEQIDIYKMLVHYHNSFKSIGNMFKKRNPNLTEKVHQLADEIKLHLKNFKK